MNLKTRIKRLEAAVGIGQKCASCRFTLRTSLPNPKKSMQPSKDVIYVRCEFCNFDFALSLAEVPEAEREAVRLQYSFTLEDYYTNPKAHALELWFSHRPQSKKNTVPRRGTVRKAKNNSSTYIFNKLLEEMNTLLAQKHKRLKFKYGDSPFPEHTQLIESVRNRENNKRDSSVYVRGVFDLEQEKTQHMICAELEKIIWGQTRPETTSAIERIEQNIDDLIKTVEMEKEEARRKNLEFLNKNRASVGLPPLPMS